MVRFALKEMFSVFRPHYSAGCEVTAGSVDWRLGEEVTEHPHFPSLVEFLLYNNTGSEVGLVALPAPIHLFIVGGKYN